MQEKFVRFAAFETVESVEVGDKKDDTAASGSTKLVNYALKVRSSTLGICAYPMDVIADMAGFLAQVGSPSSAQDLYDMIIAHLPRSE